VKKSRIFEIDFHHYYVEDAVSVVEGIINECRMSAVPRDCRFITGRGKIQRTLYELLKGVYELEPVIPLSNSGVIDVFIY
jgi:DNA-nicking Smr family endonuclease